MPNYTGSSGRTVRTIGKRPSPKLTAEEKVTKARLDAINPMLWKHLNTAPYGKSINHLRSR